MSDQNKLREILEKNFTGEQHDPLHGTFIRIPFTKQMDKAEQAIVEWVNEVQQKNEVWMPVLGYEAHYEVSNLGRVKSLARMTLGRHDKLKTSPGRILKPQLSKNGYMRFELSKDNKRVKYFVQRLLAQAFIKN